MRLKVYLLIPFCLLACVGNVQQNKPKSNTTHQRVPEKVNEEENSDFSVMFGDLTEREIDTTHIWNRIAESIYNISVPDFVHEPFAVKLLEKARDLNEEKKVRDTFSPICHPRDTLIFISHIILITGKTFCAFWKKLDDNENNFSDIYRYFYSGRKIKNPNRDDAVDSICILPNSYFSDSDYSKEFLNACNRWDTTALKTNTSLGGDDYEDEFRLVYRVIIKKGGRFSIQYVKVIHQGDANNLGTPPTMVIYRDRPKYI